MGAYYFDCKADGGFQRLHSSHNPENDCPLCRITELEAELQTAHEIGARHAKRVGEQAMELQALREAHEKNVKEFTYFANENAADTDWQIVCGYLSDRSKAALKQEEE